MEPTTKAMHGNAQQVALFMEGVVLKMSAHKVFSAISFYQFSYAASSVLHAVWAVLDAKVNELKNNDSDILYLRHKI